MRSMKKFTLAIAAVSALSMTAACGSTDEGTGSASAAEDTESSSPSESESPMESENADTQDPAANLVGPGCAEYAEAVPEGEGSVQGMSDDPVAVAASNNPVLTTLTAAVSGEVNPDVNLVDTLNGDEFTVFAPTDDAFAKIDKKTMNTLSKDADLLSTILTYHVVPGQMTPDEIAGQTLDTVQGGTIKVTGSGDNLKAAGANVVCGGVQTANATVYLVDSVLMPKM